MSTPSQLQPAHLLHHLLQLLCLAQSSRSQLLRKRCCMYHCRTCAPCRCDSRSRSRCLPPLLHVHLLQCPLRHRLQEHHRTAAAVAGSVWLEEEAAHVLPHHQPHRLPCSPPPNHRHLHRLHRSGFLAAHHDHCHRCHLHR